MINLDAEVSIFLDKLAKTVSVAMYEGANTPGKKKERLEGKDGFGVYSEE